MARTVKYTSANGNRRATGHKQSRSRTCPMPAMRSAKKTALPQRAQTSLLPVSPPLASWDGTWACARCDTFLKQQNMFCLFSHMKCPNARQVLLWSVYNIYIPVAPEPKIPIVQSGGMTNAMLTNSLILCTCTSNHTVQALAAWACALSTMFSQNKFCTAASLYTQAHIFHTSQKALFRALS